MTNQEIRNIAIANGFKLKQQPHGEMGLNPYVYDFARAIINHSSKEILENYPLPALADQERTDLNEYLKAGCFDYK